MSTDTLILESTLELARAAFNDCPKDEYVLLWIPSTGLWWPGKRANHGGMFSNAHGELNAGSRPIIATAWMKMPSAP